jgi:hypothetical protein
MTMKQTEIGTIHNLVNFKENFLLPTQNSNNCCSRGTIKTLCYYYIVYLNEKSKKIIFYFRSQGFEMSLYVSRD